MKEREYLFGPGKMEFLKMIIILTIQWIRYLARQFAYFGAPMLLVACRQWTTPYTLALMFIVASIFLHLLPELVSLAGLSDPEFSIGLILVALASLGAALLIFGDVPYKALGGLLWMTFHMFDVGGPPRLEKAQ